MRTAKINPKPAAAPAKPPAVTGRRRFPAPASGEIATAKRAAKTAAPAKAAKPVDEDVDHSALLDAADTAPVTRRNRRDDANASDDGELERILDTPDEGEPDAEDGVEEGMFVRMLTPDDRVVPVAATLVIGKLLNNFSFIVGEPSVPRAKGELEVCDRANERGWSVRARRLPRAVITKTDACQVWLGAMIADAKTMNRNDKNFDFGQIVRISKTIKAEEIAGITGHRPVAT